MITIPHPALPLDDYRVVPARQPAGASTGVRHFACSPAVPRDVRICMICESAMSHAYAP